MNIASDTKISALIKANPDAIEAIASINKHFEKLRNPVLRKLLASRVTIADAARIGKCDVEDFFRKLVPLGFTTGTAPTPHVVTPATKASLPAFVAQLAPEQLLTLDVCDDIATGHDPFLKIMDAVEKVDGNNALVIVNTFEPTPLISILVKRGYRYYSLVKSEELVHTYFWRQESEGGAKAMEAGAESLSFEEQVRRYGKNIRKLDVRHLEMPQPMVTILNELEGLPEGEALYVTHRRVPQFLLPQLQERAFSVAAKEAGPAEVYLLIYRG